jgi:nicotinate phosphoribosyltransferase
MVRMTITGPASTALRTDHYELTMIRAALRSGIAGHPSVFEVFARGLPPGRRYGVVAGIGRFCDALESFRFGPAEIDYLEETAWLDEPTLDYLADLRFTGSIDAYREGELYFPGSPVMTVQAPFAEALVLETLALSVLNFDCAVASAAARIVSAAGGRNVIEMGGRRTHEDAAVAAARAAYVAGFTSTSNLEAGRSYGIPTAGTSSHAFTLAHPDERAAFEAQVGSLGPETTLLVDTYDVEKAIRTAVEVAGTDLGAIRLDSGDLVDQAKSARRLLDDLGATKTRVVVSGDLDEHKIRKLSDAPVDTYGVGTSVVTGSGAPTAELVYKLVARAESADGPPLPVAKRSAGKATQGGRKQAWRILDANGRAIAELISSRKDAVHDFLRRTEGAASRSLQAPIFRNGKRLDQPSLVEIRELHRSVMSELTGEALDLEPGSPAINTILEGEDDAG